MTTTYDLVGAAEAAELLGIGTPNFTHLRRKITAFPEPLVVLRCGPIWNKSDIVKFSETYVPQRGRPRQVEQAPRKLTVKRPSKVSA